MEEGRGIQLWLAVIIVIILIIFIILMLLPICLNKVKSQTLEGDFIIDLQIGNYTALLHLPANLTEFKTKREIVRIPLLEAPFIYKGEIMMAIRDLENIFPAQVKWCATNRNITVFIPRGIISKNDINFSTKNYIIKNNRAFVSVKVLAKLLNASLILTPDTQGIRFIWYQDN